MKTKIKSIANIRLGYSFRSKIQKDYSGNVQVIQMKDLTNEFKVNTNNLDKTEIQNIKTHFLVQKNDLIFRTRGSDTTACILDEEVENVILVAPLLRIRIEPQNVLPEYVLWYINQTPAQVFLNSRAKGTFQKMITKKVIEELEIEIPTLEKQKRVVEISKLLQKERMLIKKLISKKDKYISTILLNSIKENNHGN
jgi:restriction endonuclease S subunit